MNDALWTGAAIIAMQFVFTISQDRHIARAVARLNEIEDKLELMTKRFDEEKDV